MNAVVDTAGVTDADPGGRFARALTMLAISGKANSRWFLALLCALLLALGVLLLNIASRPERGMTGLVACIAIAVGLLWMLWFARMVLLHVEAREARMPALVRELPLALLLASAGSVLLPALLLAAGGASLGTALLALAGAALIGLTVALLPVGVYTLLCFAPLLLALLDQALDAWLGPQWSAFARGLGVGRVPLPWLLLPLALLAVWRWRAVAAAGTAAYVSPWGRPLIAAHRSGLLWMTGIDDDLNRWRAYMPDWLWPAGSTVNAGPARQLRAMRSWLGTPFAPLRKRQVALQLGIAGVLLAVFVLPGADMQALKSLRGGAVGGVIGGAVMLVSLYGWRLEQMRQRSAGELAELAFLPGWGSAREARWTLLRAVAYAPLLAQAVVAAVVLAVVAKGVTAAGVALVMATLLGLALLTALACLRPLAGQALTHWLPIVLIGTGMLLTAVGMLLLAEHPEREPWSWLFAGWAAVYVAGATALWSAWRRFCARPHPFLQG